MRMLFCHKKQYSLFCCKEQYCVYTHMCVHFFLTRFFVAQATLEAFFNNSGGQENVFTWRAIGGGLVTLLPAMTYTLRVWLTCTASLCCQLRFYMRNIVLELCRVD